MSGHIVAYDEPGQFQCEFLFEIAWKWHVFTDYFVSDKLEMLYSAAAALFYCKVEQVSWFKVGSSPDA